MQKQRPVSGIGFNIVQRQDRRIIKDVVDVKILHLLVSVQRAGFDGKHLPLGNPCTGVSHPVQTAAGSDHNQFREVMLMKRFRHPVVAADAAQRNLLFEELPAGAERLVRPHPGGPSSGIQRHGHSPARSAAAESPDGAFFKPVVLSRQSFAPGPFSAAVAFSNSF